MAGGRILLSRPPRSPPNAATSVTTTGATLNVTVNPNGSTHHRAVPVLHQPPFSPTVPDTIGSGFSLPSGVAVDAAGDVFVADTGNNAVKEVLPDGTIKTLGSGFNPPYGVAVDAAGNVFVAAGGGGNRLGGLAADGGRDAWEVSPPTVAATPSPLTGTTGTAVSAPLTGLAPGTTYYDRVVATGAGGTVADSTVRSFTTPQATPTTTL